MTAVDQGVATIAVIASKLHPPATPPLEVRRPRLDAILDSSFQVVSIDAPAGYGKSTAVAGWLVRSPDRRSAWVSLDPFDRSPVSFWRHLTAALSNIVPGLAEIDDILVERGGPTPEFLAALIHRIDTDAGERREAEGRAVDIDDRIVLVLDDLHVVGDTAREGLTSLIERCADALRVITLSRSTPGIPVARWLAEGRAIEVRSDDLAFRSDEATALMARFELGQLGTDGLARLTEHLEGWAVGLLLSGLTLSERSDPTAALEELIGADRHLTDYLLAEVLDRLSDDLRELALAVSVPPWFDHEIARELTGRDNARALVDRLVRSNPFVIPLQSGAGYRFHHLVRSLLSTLFQRSDPDAFTQCNRVAARLMSDRGQVAEALTSLLAIGDVDAAFDLVTAPVLGTNDRGRVRELVQWLEMLGDVRPSDRVRALDLAVALLLAGRVGDALDWVERAGELVDPEGRGSAPLHAVCRLTTLAVAGLMDEAAAELPTLEAAGHDDPTSDRLDGRLSAQVVRLSLVMGDLERAERWLPLVDQNPKPIVSQVVAPALRAWLRLDTGAVEPAVDDATRACAAARRFGISPHVAEYDALLARGQAELALLRLDDLRATLEDLADSADFFDFPLYLMRLWPLQVAECALTAGWPAALELVESWDPSAHLRGGGDLTRCHRALRALSLANCGQAGKAAPIVSSLAPGAHRDLLTARVEVTAGDADAAEEALRSHAEWQVPERLEALLLLARTRPGDEAIATLTTALELAGTTRLLAPVALEGRTLDPLLAEVDVARLCPDLAAWRRSTARDRPQDRSVSIVEPLTDKERAVLLRLPSHATYRAIGAELYISVNTVKTYVSAVYRKLGVSSRADAVAAARRCGLLDG